MSDEPSFRELSSYADDHFFFPSDLDCFYCFRDIYSAAGLPVRLIKLNLHLERSAQMSQMADCLCYVNG